jgi:hypothetical protein
LNLNWNHEQGENYLQVCHIGQDEEAGFTKLLGHAKPLSTSTLKIYDDI